MCDSWDIGLLCSVITLESKCPYVGVTEPPGYKRTWKGKDRTQSKRTGKEALHNDELKPRGSRQICQPRDSAGVTCRMGIRGEAWEASFSQQCAWCQVLQRSSPSIQGTAKENTLPCDASGRSQMAIMQTVSLLGDKFSTSWVIERCGLGTVHRLGQLLESN